MGLAGESWVFQIDEHMRLRWLADSADFTDHVQICFSSVYHLQEHIFADDEGSGICYRLKTDFANDKIVCS